jgi:hypothetical protein
VVLNLSDKAQTIQLSDSSLYGQPFALFKNKTEQLSNQSWTMPAWGYEIYEY